MSASKRPIKSNLRKVDRHRIRPEEYKEAPELTAAQLATAVVIKRGPGRPALGDKRKVAVTLRLDSGVVQAYRNTGAGWQSRMNADLAKSARKLRA